MAVSQDLFDLIHSLNPSEKRYFRSYATRHVLGGENHYFRLFQAINAQSAYDEAALLAQFQGEKFTRQFSVAKNYLQQLLLQSLREYHRSKTYRMRMREMLDHFELLYEKALWRQCEKLLRRAVKLARKQDAFLDLYQWKVFEKRLLKRKDPVRSRKFLPELSRQEAHYLEQARLQSELRGIHDEVFALVARIGRVRDPQQEQELAHILDHLPMESEEQAPGFEGAVIYHYIFAYAARLRGQSTAVLRHYAAMTALWNRSPHWQAEFPERYIRTLIAYLETQFQTGDFSAFGEVLDQVKAVPARNAALRVQVFYFAHLLELRYAVHLGRLDAAWELVPGIRSGLTELAGRLPMDWRVVLDYNLISLAFLRGASKEARRWCREILAHPAGQVRKDILRAVRLLNFTLYFMEGDVDSLEHLRQSTLRFLKLEPGDHRFERRLIQGLEQAARHPAAGPHLAALHGELDALWEAGGKQILGGEEVLYWLASAAEGLPLAEHYTRTVGQKNAGSGDQQF